MQVEYTDRFPKPGMTCGNIYEVVSQYMTNPTKRFRRSYLCYRVINDNGELVSIGAKSFKIVCAD